MSRKELRLLVLDDSAADAELLLREVQRGGYSVTYDIVETAQGMRNALAGSTWDLIVSDYSMRGFTALDALEILKSGGRDIPLIVIADTIGQEGADQALAAGASDFLVKGRLSRLLSTMSRLLHDAASRAEQHRATDAGGRAESERRSLVEGLVSELNDALTLVLEFGSVAAEQVPAEAPGGAAIRELQSSAERASELAQQLQSASRGQAIPSHRPDRSPEPVSVAR